MSLSKKLDKIIKNSSAILPVSTDRGIIVGRSLIESQGFVKNIYLDNRIVYTGINLNLVAIKIANLLTKNYVKRCDELYRADQEYGKWFNDSQILRSQFEKAHKNQDYERADILWARYITSRDRTIISKSRAETLAKF